MPDTPTFGSVPAPRNANSASVTKGTPVSASYEPTSPSTGDTYLDEFGTAPQPPPPKAQVGVSVVVTSRPVAPEPVSGTTTKSIPLAQDLLSLGPSGASTPVHPPKQTAQDVGGVTPVSESVKQQIEPPSFHPTLIKTRVPVHCRLLDWDCPLSLIRLRVLPRTASIKTSELQDKLIRNLLAYIESSASESHTDAALFQPDCDRAVESLVQALLLRFLEYHQMVLDTAGEEALETCRWLSVEGYLALSYNFISPILFTSGIKLALITSWEESRKLCLQVTTRLARNLAEVHVRLVTAYWLLRERLPCDVTVEVDCSTTEFGSVKTILLNIFCAFERLALEPSAVVLSGLAPNNSGGGATPVGKSTASALPFELTHEISTPRFWDKFMIHAHAGELTDNTVPYAAPTPEVDVNEVPSAKNSLISSENNYGSDQSICSLLSRLKDERNLLLEPYRLIRLNDSTISARSQYTPTSPDRSRVSPMSGNGNSPVANYAGNAKSPKSGGPEDLIASTIYMQALERWYRDLVILEITIPETIHHTTVFEEQHGSPYVSVNGHWETYIFGRDKSGRVNICINDLAFMNVQFINFLIIWAHRSILRVPIGKVEQINVLINYHGHTLLNKRLTQLLQFLNSYYSSVVNKIYIFNTTFINRTVLQTAIRGSRQGGSGVAPAGGGVKKLIPVLIVTDVIRAEISAHQRLFQYGIGKHKMKMSSTALPVAYFP